MNLQYMNEDQYLLLRILDLHKYSVIALENNKTNNAKQYLSAASMLHRYLTQRVNMQKEVFKKGEEK